MELWSYLEKGGRRAVEVAHRRWGKDDVALHFTAKESQKKVGNYWHMLPEYGQGRKAIWNAINPRTGLKRIDEAFPQAMRSKTLNQEMYIEFRNGSSWQVVGSDNYNSIVGAPPVGIVLSEWAISNPMAWAYLAPILEENNGFAIFIYTSRGNNHGKTTYEHGLKTEGWFSQKTTAEMTDVFTIRQLKNIKSEYIKIFGKELGEAMFNQEYLCSFSGATLGAYLAQQIEDARKKGRITRIPHRTGIEVDTFWDLGVDDSMSIWFMQPVGQTYNFIDYYEGTGYGLEHYAKVMKGQKEGSEHRAEYNYGNHWMPHDAEQREMTNSEIAKSRKEVGESLGIKPIEVVPRARNMDMIVNVHIPAMRNILAQCYFDETLCFDGISGLENYRAEYDDKKKKLGNRPVHDWATHPSDAFRTFAVSDHRKNLLPNLTLPGQGISSGGGWMVG
jgi:diadenosine tetraphosphatase ApaH/serine/threonine PP2A family protein phosphatase